MKTLVSILAAVAVLGMAVGVGMAEEKKAAGLRGKVVKVDGANVTINTAKKGEEAKEVVVTTDDKTVVTIDKKEAKVADLKEGMYVFVSPATGTAQKISAMTSMGHKKKEGGEAPAK